MTVDMWITSGILVLAIVLFVTEWLRVDIVALGVVVSLMLTGILDPADALAGFSSPVVLTIASLFIVGGAVLQTGLAGLIGEQILKVAGKSQARLTAVIMLAVAVMSGFMSDTGVVAVMLPAIVSLAASARISPSRLLLPMAFASLLGGAATLIGTPPNIVVADLLRSQSLNTFGFFSFTPMGVLLLIAGTIFMVTAGRRLLPDNQPVHDIQLIDPPQELIDLYRLPDNLFQLRVRRASPLVGHTLADSRLRERFEISVLEIVRPVEPQTVARLGDQRLVVQSDEKRHIYAMQQELLQADDILIVQGDGNAVSQAAAFLNLGIQPVSTDEQEGLITHEAGIAEVLLPPRSALINRTLTEVQFGTVYHLTVLDIRRPSVKGRLSLKDTPLAFGDTLLVQGEWKNITALKQRRRDFIVIGEPEAMSGPPNRRKAWIAFLVLLGMLVLMVTGVVAITTTAMLAGLLMVLTGCLTMDEAYQSISWKSMVLIAGMLPMSTALVNVGLVDLIAGGFTATLGNFGPLVIMAGLFLLTSVLTQVLSNTATAVLIAPIALATALQLGIDPRAFLMAVAVAASMGFASPVASPVNTLVIGAGDYRFGDYIRVGLPLILIEMIVTLLALPLIWPF